MWAQWGTLGLFLVAGVASQCNNMGTCNGGSCETCSDGIMNGEETAVDCGGSDCAACVPWPTSPVPLVTSAVCRLQATTPNLQPMDGEFLFSPSVDNVYDPLEGVYTLDVEYSITRGLADGDHTYHVHRFGDNFAADGASVEEHFIGAGQREETGVLGDNMAIQVIDQGTATGKFVDKQARLNGVNSIMGRAVVVHGTPGGDEKSRAGVCIIGMAAVNEAQELLQEDTEPVTAATCDLEGLPGSSVDGILHLRMNRRNQLSVQYHIFGLPNGDFNMEVHTWGDISDPKIGIATTGNVFVSPLVEPSPGRTRAGDLGGTDTPKTSAGGFTGGFFVDTLLALNGNLGIIGRSIVIESTAGEPLAQCVIGVLGEVSDGLPYAPDPIQVPLAVQPVTLRSQALLASTTAAVMDAFVEINSLPHNHPTHPDQTRIKILARGLDPALDYHLVVHQYGGPADGSDIGAMFVGWGDEAPVGHVGHGRVLKAREDGVLIDDFYDTARMNFGANSVVGRSIALHRNEPTGPMVAVGNVGVAAETFAARMFAHPPVTAARCHFEETEASTSSNLRGTATLTEPVIGAGVNVAWDLQGMNAGSYSWHVQDFGNLADTLSGKSTAGRFRGEGVTRGTCIPPEAGFIGDGQLLTVGGGGTSSGNFDDTDLSINGVNTVVGRSIIIHDSTGARVGMCVIAIVGEAADYTPPDDQLNYIPTGCDDGIQNGDEEGVDCGGPDCPICEVDPDRPRPTPMVNQAPSVTLQAVWLLLAASVALML
eukprot:CAMPEP_0205824828 /NCGR_PEP_ID=MMETSP0206-20130828/22867_1 /ASSEMBLY_ACC=CAM_ASM_000279 /TAXON_ID=36767 /ORGANISM="Euplotes focardii, Strain TN1" /LENGTH=764 /DNA_ID=CAMNT_0053123317 /DNA_START=29 /DNA_END=2323 /DNA_ORIENTATION=+